MKMIWFLGLFCSTLAFAKDQRLVNAESSLPEKPIVAFNFAIGVADSDEKFALLYKIDQQIASKVNFSYQPENEFRIYVLKNKERFTQNSEPAQDTFRASDYWLKKIGNKSLPVFGDFKFDEISSLEIGIYDGGIEDDEEKNILVEAYSKWLKEFSRHPKADEVKSKLENLKKLNPGE